MISKTSFSIIGTGAVGGYYGGLLQKAGFDVHFLVNSDFDHVRNHGLKIDSPNGNFALPKVQAYNTPKDLPACDVVIIALKTTSNTALPNILPHVIHNDSIILTLQNGLGSEEAIATQIPAHQILGGLCFLCSNKIGPGHIHHLDYGLITLGEYRPDQSAGGITPRLKKLEEQLSFSGIPARAVENLALARWKKLVWNIPFNGMSVAEDKLTKELILSEPTRTRCIKMMHEVANAAAACGHQIEPEFIDKMISDTEKMKPYAPSMKLDFDRGNPMEIDAIYGIPLKTARSHGIEMPETRTLYSRLQKLQNTI